MVGWHHQLNGHESEQTLGDSEGQAPLSFTISQSLLRLWEIVKDRGAWRAQPMGHKESDTT